MGFLEKIYFIYIKKYCSQIDPQVVYTPEEGADKAYMHFKNVNCQLELPFVIYADMECFIQNDKHIPASYSYKVVSHHSRYV